MVCIPLTSMGDSQASENFILAETLLAWTERGKARGKEGKITPKAEL